MELREALAVLDSERESLRERIRMLEQECQERERRRVRLAAEIETARATQERLGIDDSKVMVNIDKYGNTTAATIPLGLRDALAQGRLRKGDLVLIATVGAGYTTGGVLLRWDY